MAANEKDETYLSPAVFIFRPVPFGATLAASKSALSIGQDDGEVGADQAFMIKAAQAARISGGRSDGSGDEKRGGASRAPDGGRCGKPG
jgi:hypothetical protein